MGYKLKSANLIVSRKKVAVLIASFFTVLAVIFYLSPATQGNMIPFDKDLGIVAKNLNDRAHLEPLVPAAQVIPPEIVCVEKSRVSKGDTPSTILEGHIPLKTIYALSKKSKQTYPLTKIRRAHQYKIFNRDDSFFSFEYEINSEEKLVIVETGNGYSIRREPIPFTVEIKKIEEKITTSLFAAVEKAGEKHKLGLKLTDIFAWDIDFSRDIRPGDSFSVIVEKRFREGKETGYGNILAASFLNRGMTNNAFLFKDSTSKSAYYNEVGNSLRKSFLKAPLTFSKISSGYSNSRLHPILNKIRAHKAIDYAAPTGTPIKTVGDGVISTKKKNRAAGNYIIVRHNNGYETVYNHMSRFAKGIKKGKRVVQGEVIGYVGSTGLATGPHLDFRMKKNGKYINPLKVKTTSAEPVSPLDMDMFKKRISPLMSKLDVKRIKKTASRTEKSLTGA